MTILKLLLAFALCLFSFNALAQTSPEDIPLSFPFFQSGQSSGIRDELMVGYGDYCDLGQQLHMGIDFLPESDNDQVLNPFNIPMYSIGAYYVPNAVDYTGCIIGIGLGGSDYGWAIEHLGPDIFDVIALDSWCSNYKRDEPLAPQMPIDTCCNYSTVVPLHTHIQWSYWFTDPSSPGGAIMPNPWDALVNPMDFFTDSSELAGYDQIAFNNVWAEHDWFGTLPDSTNTGMFFLPDGITNSVEYNQMLGVDSWKYQDIVHGAVDIAVAPFSSLLSFPDNEGCGVQSVGYEILRQNPISQIWESTESAEGNWGYRELFRAEGQIEEPSVWLDIYYSLFFHKGYFFNNYMLTNSGAEDPSMWDHGWDNVWTVASINDWVNGICQGAWDTFLAIPDIWPNPPTQNSEAFFPDGRYAVKVTAVSHGSRDTDSLRLPVDDLSLPDPLTEGVVVDNFLPHIVRVAAYTWDPAADTCHKIYAGYWEDINPVRQLMAESEYLEQLRAELHALQSINQVDALPSRSVFNLPESFSQSLLEHDYQAERNRLSREYPDGTETFEPGCCLDEGIGQDPIDQLLEEIARVENQQVFNADTTRIFDDQVYGYLPINGLPLVLQVFYSEPTKTDISDRIYFRNYIGPDTSGEYTFRRLSGNFELPLPRDNTASGREIELSDVLLDSSNVVYYIYKNLPQYYQGNILLYFGDANLQDDEGPRDLAGNKTDGYPGTVAEPRNDYGPFSYAGFEQGPDTGYSWDPPNWYRYSNTVYGTVGIEQDLVATVDLDPMGLDNGIFLGDCDYWCGFWLYHDEYDEYGFDIYVFIQNVIGYKIHSFNTPYPVGGINYEQNWFGSLGGFSLDTRYYWMTGITIDLINNRSTAFAYCVDSETGAKPSHRLCSGYCTWGTRCIVSNLQNEEYLGLIDEKWSILHCYAEVLNIDIDGGAYIEHSYRESIFPFNSVVDTTYLSPPGGSDDNLFGDMYCSSDISSDAEEVIEILSNPVRETLDVKLIGEAGDDFEVILYDIAGRRVLSESGVNRDDESVLNIRVEDLPSGVYLLRIRSGSFETVRTISIVR